MNFVIALLLNLTIASTAFAQSGAGRDWEDRVDRWETVKHPPALRSVEGCKFFYKANHARLHWQVYLDEGAVRALPSGSLPLSRRKQVPEFDTRVDGFIFAHTAQLVDDGWLIGFNQGEFGAALYWFSMDGSKSYKVSDHQLEEFFEIGGEIYAIEGLAHLRFNRGSFIRLDRDMESERWMASTILEFPSAPNVGVLGKDETLYVVLSNGIVAVKSSDELTVVMPKASWGGLYPSSAVLSQDGSGLYIGMRQFVGKYDLRHKEFSLLIPDKEMINENVPPEFEGYCRNLEDR